MTENPITVLDIESTGLNSLTDSVTVVGLLTGDHKNFSVWQKTSTSESGLLDATFEVLHDKEMDGGTLVTFYGKGFDVPFLLDRAKKNGINPSDKVRDWLKSEHRHVDLNAKIYTTPALKKFLTSDTKERMSKNRLAKLLGIYVPANMDGGACALTAEAWLDDTLNDRHFEVDMLEVAQHNLLDLVTTWQILNQFKRRKWL